MSFDWSKGDVIATHHVPSEVALDLDHLASSILRLLPVHYLQSVVCSWGLCGGVGGIVM